MKSLNSLCGVINESENCQSYLCVHKERVKCLLRRAYKKRSTKLLLLLAEIFIKNAKKLLTTPQNVFIFQNKETESTVIAWIWSDSECEQWFWNSESSTRRTGTEPTEYSSISTVSNKSIVSNIWCFGHANHVPTSLTNTTSSTAQW